MIKLNQKKLKFLGIGLAVVAVLVAVIFWRRSKSATLQVQTETVTRGTIVASVSASGQVLTANLVNLTTSVTGLVNQIYVQDGDQVKVGQKIMMITPDATGKQKAAAAYAAYLSTKNSLVSAQTTLYTLQSQMFAANQAFMNGAVARELATDDPVYVQENADWLAAEAKYKNQQNVIAQSQSGVSNAWLAYQAAAPTVTAPLDGEITNLTYLPGMTLDDSQSSPRIGVIKLSGTPLASFNVSEIDVSRLQPGQKATIKLDSLNDKTFTGKVVSIDRIGTATSGVVNYPVIIRLDTEAPEILPNMSATAEIILAIKNDILLVSSAAIKLQGDQSVVQVKRNGQAQTVVIETGISSDIQTEILSGLSEGDEVVVASLSATSNQTGSSVFSTRGFGGSMRPRD